MSDVVELEVGYGHGTVDEAFVSALGELTNPVAAESAEIETRGGGSYGYKYADLSSIMTAVRPVMARHGLAISQPVQTIDDSLAVETLVMHTSGGIITSGRLVVRMPPNPQQTGSTITYLRRYQLCALLGIAPDDDDDGKAASPVTRPRATTKRKETATAKHVDRTTGEIAPDPRTSSTGARTPLTDAQRRHIMVMFNALGLGGDDNRDARLAYTSNAIGREITTTNDVTRNEAITLIEVLIADTNERHDDLDGGYQ